MLSPVKPARLRAQRALGAATTLVSEDHGLGHGIEFGIPASPLCAGGFIPQKGGEQPAFRHA